MNKKEIQIQDFGEILRQLRLNHGYSQRQMAKKVGIDPQKISRIERSVDEVPNEPLLRKWLDVLGSVDNKKELLRLYRQHRVVHHVRLHRKDQSNADMIRLLEAYKEEKLSQFDRDMLSLIARGD